MMVSAAVPVVGSLKTRRNAYVNDELAMVYWKFQIARLTARHPEGDLKTITIVNHRLSSFFPPHRWLAVQLALLPLAWKVLCLLSQIHDKCLYKNWTPSLSRPSRSIRRRLRLPTQVAASRAFLSTAKNPQALYRTHGDIKGSMLQTILVLGARIHILCRTSKIPSESWIQPRPLVRWLS